MLKPDCTGCPYPNAVTESALFKAIMMEKRKLLCRSQDLPEGSSRGFIVDTCHGREDMFLVCKNGQLFGYRNSCPHTGSPLDWVPDRFLNLDGDLIQCATHDALFRIEDGTCIAGPCVGKVLQPVSVTLCNDEIFLILD